MNGVAVKMDITFAVEQSQSNINIETMQMENIINSIIIGLRESKN